MTNRIQNKRSSTENNPPTAAQLEPGEIAINTNATTPHIHFEDAGNTVRSIGADPTAVGNYVRRVTAAGTANDWVTEGSLLPDGGDGDGDYGFWTRDDDNDRLTPRAAGDQVAIQNDELAVFTVGEDFDGSGSNHLGIYYGNTLPQGTFNADIFVSNGDLRIRTDGNENQDTGTIHLVSGFANDTGSVQITPADGNISTTGDLTVDGTINHITVGRGGGDGASNTAVGLNVLANNQAAGTNNSAFGRFAMRNNTTGTKNTAVGSYALHFNTEGDFNTACGQAALYANTEGNNNTAVGTDALYSNTTGSSNVAIGRQALQQNTIGTGNVGVGTNALLGNTEGTDNVALGRAALQLSTTGDTNVAIGAGALYNNATGADNTALGRAAGRFRIDGQPAVNLSNCNNLGTDTKCSGSNQVQLGNASTTTYAYGAVQDRSDARDKTDIRDTLLGLEFIKSLRPVDFRWDYRDDYLDEQQVTTASGEVDVQLVAATKDGSRSRTRFHHGLIAQEVKAVADAHGIDFGGYQDHSIEGGSDVLTLGYTELIAPLIKATQELSAENAELKERIEQLEAAGDSALLGRVEQLERENTIDDASDNALLVLVGELSSRVQQLEDEVTS